MNIMYTDSMQTAGCCNQISLFLSPSQRDLSDNDIILGLKMYESQMSRMQNKIAKQLAIMKKQRRRIENIKFYLKRKGDDYQKDDLKGDIVFQTDKAKERLQLASLDNLVRETDHHEKGQKVSDRCQSQRFTPRVNSMVHR